MQAEKHEDGEPREAMSIEGPAVELGAFIGRTLKATNESSADVRSSSATSSGSYYYDTEANYQGQNADKCRREY
jgi:hypothetical protein